MTTAEGGMITTNDPEVARRLRLLRSHGMTVTSWDRDKGRPAQYDVLEFGFNFRLDDIRAALGLVQLEKLQLFNQKRAELVRRYNDGFSRANLDVLLPFVSVQQPKEPSYHLYPIVLSSPQERDRVAELLKAEGIQTSIHYPPIHHFSAFRESGRAADLPLTEAFASRELTLPLYPSLSFAQVDAIVAAVVNACDTTHRLRH